MNPKREATGAMQRGDRRMRRVQRVSKLMCREHSFAGALAGLTYKALQQWLTVALLAPCWCQVPRVC